MNFMRGICCTLLLLLALGCTQTKEPMPEEPKALSKLTWNYLQPVAPEKFVIERRLEGKAWEEIATVPGATGTELTYTDSTLAPTTAPQTVYYRVHAVTGSQRSVVSNRATTILPAVPPVPPFPEGTACVVTNITSTAVTITCPLVQPSKARR